MRKKLNTLLLLALTVFTLKAQDQPNIVFILADDLGYGDLGCFGHPSIETPELDRMASEGIRLTSFYAAAPVCSPARVGLLTGRISSRVGVYDWIPPGSDVHLPVEETTVAELLRSAGYETVYLGKWHLNGMRGPGVPILAGDSHHPGVFGFEDALELVGAGRQIDGEQVPILIDSQHRTLALVGNPVGVGIGRQALVDLLGIVDPVVTPVEA